MDIKNTVISAKVVIESLICLLENENVDLSSIKFKVGSASEGYESPNMEFEKLIELTLNGLEDAKAQVVPDGFVLVEKCDIEMMLKLIDNSLAYKSAPNKDDTMKIVKNMLIRITDAQEQSHDGF